MERTKEEIYDFLYDLADMEIRKHNPCKVEDGKCIRGYFCCRGCKHLSSVGCTVKGLYCKIWLCQSVLQKLHEKTPESLTLLRAIGELAGIYGLLQYRRSKEETLGQRILLQ